ncbi:MAG TPA: hypothetical protein DDW91_07960, partial [Shewanella frigidimarina]|nr:hypothetical protein [Shewanella frigidimarina]
MASQAVLLSDAIADDRKDVDVNIPEFTKANIAPTTDEVIPESSASKAQENLLHSTVTIPATRFITGTQSGSVM